MSIPIVILGGSDRRPAQLPESGAELHPLAAYKGAALAIGGRPLVACLVERLKAAGLGPVAVVGPERIYGPLGLDAEGVDSDGALGENLRAAIEWRAGRAGPMGMIACDVLPTVRELAACARDYTDTPCRLWLPLIRKPADPERLGVFAWKPSYPLLPAEGSEPVYVLPSHLGFFEPDALRLPLLYRLLEAAYRSRNRPLSHRRRAMLRAALAGLLLNDLRQLARLRPPTRTVTSVYSGLKLVNELRTAHLSIEGLERIVGRIFLRERCDGLPHAERVRCPLLDLLSLAADIDTMEEAEEVGARPEVPVDGEDD